MNPCAPVGGGGLSPIQHLAGLYEKVAEDNTRHLATMVAGTEAWSRADILGNKLMAGVDLALLHSAPTNLADAATLLAKVDDYSQIVLDHLADTGIADIGEAVCAAIRNISSFVGWSARSEDPERLAGTPGIDRTAWQEATSAYWAASAHHQVVSDSDKVAATAALAAVDAALARLLSTTAPDRAALAEKVEIIDREGFQAEQTAFQALTRDALRLAAR